MAFSVAPTLGKGKRISAPCSRELRQRIQQAADRLQLGVEIVCVNMNDAHPPVKDVAPAFQDVLARLNERPQEELKGVRWSVPDKMDFVLNRVRTEGQTAFSALFNERSPRGEVIVTFLALLELLRQHRIIVYQNAAFHEITVLPSKEMPDDKPLEAPDDYGG